MGMLCSSGEKKLYTTPVLMSQKPGTSISITFRTPDGDHSPFHERLLAGVPESKALKIAQDFAEHQDAESGASPYQLYRYEDEDGERLLALDFNEVVDVDI